MHKRKVAVFDFDGTITKRDTFIPFLLSYGPGKIIRSAFKTAWQRKKGNFRNTLKANALRKYLQGIQTRDFSTME